MTGFIYIWYDKKLKRYYIGSHFGTIDDGYICSSTWMKRAYKRRPQDFKRRIIFQSNISRKELFEEEQKWLNLIKLEELSKRYYNLTKSVKKLWHSDDLLRKTVGEKISLALKGKKFKGHIKSEEAKRNISLSMIGKKRGPPSQETRDKISKANKGRIIHEEWRKNMSISHIGKPSLNKGKKFGPLSFEHKEKISKSVSEFYKNK